MENPVLTNESQIDFWNGPAAQKWVLHADQLDQMLSPFAAEVLVTASIVPSENTIDIGCGSGALTLKVATAAGPKASTLGVDVSQPLIDLARQRAEQASSTAQYVVADASIYRAETPVDIIISRFGVMFFNDPVPAFANLLANTVPGGRMVFVCWQALQVNDWAFAPLQAARPFFKQPPEPGDPTAPGPFAFADKDRLSNILSDAGWKSVEINPMQTPLTMPGTDIEANIEFMLKLGPLSRLIAEQDLELAPIETAMFERLSHAKTAEGTVEMASACWIVQASA